MIAVLGAGLAGLAAAQRLGRAGYDVAIYERNAYAGGHATSHHASGFVFDEGPHVSFTKNAQIQALLAESVKGEYVEQQAIILNYYRGLWIKHPVQTNLHGLPPALVRDAIVDFVASQSDEPAPPVNYAEWCYRHLGRTLSEAFVFPYTRKYWTTDASNMSVDWVGSRVYRPTLQQVLDGALSPSAGNHHYLQTFRYPIRGGFASYVHGIAEGLAVDFDHEVVVIDLARRTLAFANGRRASFERLMSSLPLPVLIGLITDAPADVRAAADGLSCTSLVLVNVGVEHPGRLDAHWIYVYDEDVVFARASFPHRLSEHNVPPGCSSVQAEVYHSKYRPLPCDDVVSRTVEDLQRTGVIDPRDRIVVTHEQRIPYANILFDVDRARHLAAVQAYLDRVGVACCGRYGEWGYYWTDDSILSGWRAAERVIEGVKP